MSQSDPFHPKWGWIGRKILNCSLYILCPIACLCTINGSLASVDFSGEVFTCGYLNKNVQKFNLCVNSFTHAFLVTNDLNAGNLVHADFARF